MWGTVTHSPVSVGVCVCVCVCCGGYNSVPGLSLTREVGGGAPSGLSPGGGGGWGC